MLDEAIQCYHGDLEFQDMLIAVISFSESDLAESVRDELKDRMEFDAKHGRGVLKKRAQLIIENLDKYALFSVPGILLRFRMRSGERLF